jgi:CxxC motif-containing protein (DUF1111 family)
MRFGLVVPSIIGCLLLSACTEQDPADVERAADVTLTEEEDGDFPPLAGLSAAELAAFEAGKVVFARFFAENEGLGPLFNEASCGECHEDPGLGGSGDEVEVHFAFEAGAPTPCDGLAAVGGNVLQTFATSLLQAAGYNTEPETTLPHSKGGRTTPDVLGFGLIDAITDAEILSRADPNDANGDGISGRAHITAAGVGRFGRKANEHSLDAFNAGAFLAEMGITTPAHPVEESIGGLSIPGIDPAADPELSQNDVDLTNAFVRFLAPPKQLPFTQQALAGKTLFSSIGCNSCHTPNMKTGPNPVRALDKVNVQLFSDLLLHDIGTGDGPPKDICNGDATSKEFRTEPLMGLRMNPAFLHDGRASTIEHAILLHGGEAAAVRNNFNALGATQRKALLAYLNAI